MKADDLQGYNVAMHDPPAHRRIPRIRSAPAVALALLMGVVCCAPPAQRATGGEAGASPEQPFVAPWLLGNWFGGPSVIRTGPNTVRLAYHGGNTYEETVVVKGDVVEFHGTFNGSPSVMKWRRIDDATAEYFYHFYEGREHPARSTLHKE